MNKRWRPLAGLFLLACLQPALGASDLTLLHSFGFPNASAANPAGELIAGSDGALYGTTSAGGQANQGTVFRINQDRSGFHLLWSFGGGTNDGARPFAALREGSDGALYGTTEGGGQFGFGAVFQLSKDGSQFGILKSFTGDDDGAFPEARLLEGSDGLLYGTASGGGTNDYGVIFRLAKDGSGYTTLRRFVGTNGANPECGLIEASDGMLYGTTYSTNSTNLGTIFRLQKDGSGFAVLKSFFNTGFIKTSGAGPQGALVEGTNGLLYGATSAGGTNATGTVFQLNKDGTGFKALYHFAPITTADARIPLSDLLLASDGMLYGTCYDGGTKGNGAVYRIDHEGTTYEVVASLAGAQGPACGLIEGTNGMLFGTTQLGGDSGAGTVYALQKDGSGFVVLKSFSPTGGDGQSPYSAPIGASDTALYGTTRLGGSAAAGTVYTLRFDGLAYAVVAPLEQDPVGAMNPIGSLLEATNGVLYGVTQSGGSSNNGTLFSLDKFSTNFSLVYSATNGTDGRELRGSVIQASDGVLYGTTVLGGSSRKGTVFSINADGSGYTILKNFASASGANPVQALLEASDHILYGTTVGGGTTNRGVIFNLTKDGASYNVLKSFGAPADEGESPMSPLLEATDGMLYGTTYGGGGTNNAGTVFRLNKDGTGFSILLAFIGLGQDGRHPCGNLVEWVKGSLYGTTERGGTNDQGVLFRLNKDGGGYEVLANFGGVLGAYPRGGLLRGPDGALYGTTDQGGEMGLGTVFRYGSPFGEITDLQLLDGIPSLTCLGLPGTNYVLEQTVQLGPSASWSPVYSTNAPPNGQFSVLDQSLLPGGGQQTFYRLKH